MARRTLLAALQPYRRRSQRAVDALRAVDPDRIGLPISQERTRHTPHLSSTGASRRRAHSDRLPRLLFASDATHREAEIAFAQPTATAPRCAKKELLNRSTDRPVGGPFVV